MANQDCYWNGSTSANADVAANWEDFAGAPLGKIPTQVDAGDSVFFLGARCSGADTCDSRIAGPLMVVGTYFEDAAYAAMGPQTLEGARGPIGVSGVVTTYHDYTITLGGDFNPSTWYCHADTVLDDFGVMGDIYLYDDKVITYCMAPITFSTGSWDDVFLMSAAARIVAIGAAFGVSVDAALVVAAASDVRSDIPNGFSDAPETGTLVVPRRTVRM